MAGVSVGCQGARGPRQKLAGGPEGDRERLFASSPPRSGRRGPIWIDGLRPRDAAGGTEACPCGPRLAGRWAGVAPAPRSVLATPSERAEAHFGVLSRWSAN